MTDERETPRVLVVEDEPALAETLEYSLARQGYDVSVATDGVAALETARGERPDLIVLDVMLPRMDGYEVCRVLRQEMNVPILMLTARTDEVDKIVGLEVGADDYMTKPFSMRELTARVKALLRRVRLMREETNQSGLASGGAAAAIRPGSASAALQADFPSEQMVLGDLVIDLSRREARLRGDVIHLKPKEFDLLAFLARNRGIVLSRELTLERVWGWEFDGGSRTVDVHVRWLREKIEDDPSHPTRIVTVRGIGYRFDG